MCLEITRSVEWIPAFAGMTNGGERGIRTPDTLAGTPDFESGTFNHSASSP